MTGKNYDLAAITEGAAIASGVPHGGVLLAFVDAVLGGDAGVLMKARRAVRAALGDAAFVDAAATVASFNAVVKIADGTGIPLEVAKEARTLELRAALGIDTLRR